MIKAIIIDDESSSVELTSVMLEFYKDTISLSATGNSVEEGYRLIRTHKPDLVFLDVQMEDGSGFDLLNKLGSIDFKVVFITAHNEFALRALRYSAMDYLLKPLSPLEFSEAVRKSMQAINHDEVNLQMKSLLHNIAAQQQQQQQQQHRKIVFKTQEKIYSVDTPNIVRFEAEGSYTTVYLAEGKKIIVSRIIKDFEEMLAPEGFIRVHQSHLVNRNYIFCFEKQDNVITMKDGTNVPVSTRKKDMVLHLIQSS
jgi:two-component system LytT family response regulator